MKPDRLVHLLAVTGAAFALASCDNSETTVNGGPRGKAELPIRAMPLNDTGVDYYIDYAEHSDDEAIADILTSEPLDYPGQDASHGRDVSDLGDNDGRLGFRFKHLPSEEDKQCVLDETTGLYWESKNAIASDPHLHYRLYNWHEPDNGKNGGYAGVDGEASECSTPNAKRTFSGDTRGFIRLVNEESLCGFSDWRLPTIMELRSLMDYGAEPGKAMADTRYFPYLGLNDHFWSNQTSPSDSSRAWAVHFTDGRTEDHPKTCDVQLSCQLPGVALLQVEALFDINSAQDSADCLADERNQVNNNVCERVWETAPVHLFDIPDNDPDEEARCLRELGNDGKPVNRIVDSGTVFTNALILVRGPGAQ